MSDIAVEPDAITQEQAQFLPAGWRRIDSAIIRTTQTLLFVVGALFTGMIVLEVLSRYTLNFSIFFINSAARFLLVWFFLLGAGLGLRHGAHVGFDILLNNVHGRLRRNLVLFGHVLILIFLMEILWSGLYMLPAALNQSEPALGISVFWAILAIPVGFGLLIYHLAALATVELRRPMNTPPS